jgi:hypothetical protein
MSEPSLRGRAAARSIVASLGLALIVFTASCSVGSPGVADACATINSERVGVALGQPVGEPSKITPESGAPAGIGGCTFRADADSSNVVLWYMDHDGADMYERQRSAQELVHTPLLLPDADAFSAVVGHFQTVFVLSRGRYLNVLVETPTPPFSADLADRVARAVLAEIGPA